MTKSCDCVLLLYSCIYTVRIHIFLKIDMRISLTQLHVFLFEATLNGRIELDGMLSEFVFFFLTMLPFFHV